MKQLVPAILVYVTVGVPFLISAQEKSAAPQIRNGIASGDVTSDSAVIWSRADRPSRMIVEYSLAKDFSESMRVLGPDALEVSDFTAKMILRELPSGKKIHYRVAFQSLENTRQFSPPVTGSFHTATATKSADVRFAWSGDTAGQGWGIDEARGGMTIYETMRRLKPDFFIHCGDTIYADGPLQPEVLLDDGSIWKNLVTPEKSKVAETLAEFRGNFRYNLLDANVRRFQAEVPIIVQWDDHETTNNWYPDESLAGDDRYTVKSAALLAARSRRAFLEYHPIRRHPDDTGRIYRKIDYGPDIDVFVLDLRSYRGANSANRQSHPGPQTKLFGNPQMEWLTRELRASTATWKIIASDLPLGLLVRDGEDAFEAIANGDGPPQGRELEIAKLLATLKSKKIHNLVWLTADVHYAAAHFYDPASAQFQDFNPFWEFVSGPLHAGNFGPNKLDNTFGPQLKFLAIPEDLKPNRPPSEGMQFFGLIDFDAETRHLTVRQFNTAGDELFKVKLEPR